MVKFLVLVYDGGGGGLFLFLLVRLCVRFSTTGEKFKKLK